MKKRFAKKILLLVFVAIFIAGWLGIGYLVKGNDVGSSPISDAVLTLEPSSVMNTSHVITLDCDPGTDISEDIRIAADDLKALGGGTIILPEGEFLFDSIVRMPGGISLIGQGIEKTKLLATDNTSGFLDINPKASEGGSFRISGISFLGYTHPVFNSDGVLRGYWTHSAISLNNIDGFRIDHCLFEGFAYTVNVNSNNVTYPVSHGVVDHCVFIKGRATFSSMYGVTTTIYGWNDNNRLQNLGSDKVTFVENCYFNGLSHPTDAFSGGQYVLRYSTIVDCSAIGGHGPGFAGDGRGTRLTEIYHNLIKKTRGASDGMRWLGINVRGGASMVFNNTFEYCRYGMQFTLDNPRVFTFDNDNGLSSNGNPIPDYPVLDQPTQRWIWDNALVDTPQLIMYYGEFSPYLIQQDRDYFLREPTLEEDGFSYTPYQYPHPYAQDSSDEPTPVYTTPPFVAQPTPLPNPTGNPTPVPTTSPTPTDEPMLPDDNIWLSPKTIVTSNDSKRVENIADLDTTTMWTPDVWLEQPYWVVIDLGESHSVDGVRQWHQKWSREAAIVEIYVSDDLDDWGESLGAGLDFHAEDTGWNTTAITNKTGRYVKLVSRVCSSPNWREIEIGIAGADDNGSVDPILPTGFNWLSPKTIVTSNDSKRVENIADLDTTTMWTPDVWLEQPYWVVIDLGESRTVDGVRQWHQKWSREAAIVEIYVSDNPNDWGESLGAGLDFHAEDTGWNTTAITNKTGRYVKLVSRVCSSPNWREIEVYVD